MSYDFDAASDRSPPIVATFKPEPRDLETIVTLMQLAALELTPDKGAEFTEAQLMASMRDFAGDDCALDAADVRIVLAHASFLKKKDGRYTLK